MPEGGLLGVVTPMDTSGKCVQTPPRYRHDMTQAAEPHILLVEDNEDDAFLLTRALRTAEIANPVHVVTDGEQAVGYLQGTGQFSDRTQYPMPGLILLDLKLPRISGL